jgi:hypothetical protein
LSRFSQDADSESRLAAPGRAANRAHTPRHILAIMLLLGLPVAAQSPGLPPQPSQDGRIPQRDAEAQRGADMDARMEARNIVALNRQRQKQMVLDAENLLKLARELNADADAGGTILSPAERFQKAGEIEKLAKNVKEKMIYAIGAPQDLAGPFGAWQR